MANSFAAAIQSSVAELKRVKESLTLSYQETILDVGESLVFFTPLKTGLASSNWSVTNSGHKSAERGILSGKKGLASLQAMTSQVKVLDFSKAAIFNNPVHYIDDLEMGSSRQAPAGMITPTKARIDDLWLANLKKNKLI